MTRAPMRSTRRPRARIARRSVDSRGGRQHRSRAFSITITIASPMSSRRRVPTTRMDGLDKT